MQGQRIIVTECNMPEPEFGPLCSDEVAANSEQGRRDPENVSLWIVWIRNLFPFSSLSPTLYLMHNSNSFFGPVIMITLFSCEWSVMFLFLPLKLK